MAECMLLPLLLLDKKFPSLLACAWFVVKYFSFVKQIVLVVFSDFYYVIAKPPIFLFICLQMFAFEFFQYDLIIDIYE